jgi:glycosyltransferase involved in cell wall biosynthesis
MGKVVPAGDPASLAEAILELLALDSASRRALGAECRERIRQEYSLEKVAGIYEDLYASS